MTKIRHQVYRRMTRKRSLLLKTCEDCDCACMDIQWNSKVAGILVISNLLNDIWNDNNDIYHISIRI